MSTANVTTNSNPIASASTNQCNPALSKASIFQSPSFRNAVTAASIPSLWEHFDLPGSPHRSCHSPFRKDQKPSFSVYQNSDGVWRFKDHGGEAVHGDAYEFWLLAAEKKKCAASAQEFIQLVASLPESGDPYCTGVEDGLTASHSGAVDFTSLAAEYSANLRGDTSIQERVAADLGVQVSTVSGLAKEGSLGFSPELGGMTVLNQHGIFVRKSNGRGQNLQGSRLDLWRGCASRSAERVILTEGASDAIAAIDAGLEDDSTTAVVALPSASTSFSEPGIGVLDGKDVMLVPDRDEAGGRMAEKAKESLVRIVRSLRVFLWHLVLERHPDLYNSNVKDLRDLHARLGADATAELLRTCSPPVEPDPVDSSSSGPCSTADDDIPPEPLSSSFPDVLDRNVEPEGELIQHGFLRKGHTMTIVAPSGTGKSSLTMQIGASFALGTECLGFQPARPLTVLLVQSENDDADQKEVAQGVFRGLGLTGEDLEILRHRFFFRECQDSGDGFLDGMFRDLLAERQYDIVIIDPYGDFQADTANNEQQVKAFLVKLRHIIKESGCGCILVHHTPKPSKDKSPSGPYDDQYRGYGSSLFSNHVRASILLKPLNTRGIFEMKAVKRGERLRWIDENGNPTFSKFIRHADPGQGIYWQLATPEEVAAERGIELDDDGGRKKGEEDVIRFLEAHDGPVEKDLVVAHLNADPGSLALNKAGSLLKKMLQAEDIFEHALPRAGRKAAVGLALTPPGEPNSAGQENTHGRGDHGMDAST